MSNITWTSRNGYVDRSIKYSAVCAKCKKNCEVPFKPTEGRSVFCRDCYNE